MREASPSLVKYISSDIYASTLLIETFNYSFNSILYSIRSKSHVETHDHTLSFKHTERLRETHRYRHIEILTHPNTFQRHTHKLTHPSAHEGKGNIAMT